MSEDPRVTPPSPGDTPPVRARPLVAIVGAGFGGLWAIRALARTPCEVVLIDRCNFHTFYPLLYQVGAAELEPEQIVYPVRSILRKMPNVGFLMDEVKRVDLSRRVVECARHAISYDYLVLAAGSAPDFFGVPGAEENAYPIRNLSEGVMVRNRILSCFEEAVYETTPEARQRLLTFTIVGGGPTGVEYAGALAELINGPLRKDYPTIDFSEVRIVMLEGNDTLLTGMPDDLVQYALERLRKKKVEVRLNTLASEITPTGVRVSDGGFLDSRTVVWTAGVRASQVAEASGLPTGKRGQVTVTPTLQVEGHPEAYVVGDLALVQNNGGPMPMVAPVAMQQGEAAARNILRQIRGEEPRRFRYNDRGSLAVIGRNAAVADLGRVKVKGFVAWALWLIVHIFRLIGFRNRLQVMVNWAWSYIFYEQGVRVIVETGDKDASGPGAVGQPEAQRRQEPLIRERDCPTDDERAA